jgi:hypothetical protein
LTPADRRVRRALAAILLGDEPRAAAVADRLSRGDWEALVALAGAWRVLPPLRRRLRTLDPPPLPEVTATLRRSSAAAAAQSAFVVHGAARVVDQLAAAGVASAVCKGVGLVGALGLDPSERMLLDVDLLVAPADAGRALAVLTRSGAQVVDFPGTPDALTNPAAWQAVLARRSTLGNLAVAIRDADGLEIDVHWGLGTGGGASVDPVAIIGRAQPAAVPGGSLRVAAPADAVLITLDHALRSGLVPATTLKDLDDLVTWWRADERWDQAVVAHDAANVGLDGALIAAWRLISRWGALPAAAAEADRLGRALPAPAARRAAALIGAFDDQLDRGALHDDLLVFLTSPARLRLVADWARRRLHGSPAAAAPGVPPRPLGERCRRLAAEARPGRLASYRAIIGAQGSHRSAKRKA